MSLISVIIPCYRDAATLGRALDSVYSQTHSVDEIVVVNDCSPESEAIESVLRNYPHVVYIRNTRNFGLAASRNVGLHATSGEIVSFLDADDELHPQKIEFQLDVFRPDIAVACRVRRIGTDTGRAETTPYGKSFRIKTFTNSREIIWRNRVTGASLMISRELLLRFNGYDEALCSCEDFDLWLRLLDAGVVVRDIQLPLYLYRLNESSLSNNYPDISYWELETISKYFHRQGREFMKSSYDAYIWAFWLVKHMLRYEKCLNDSLNKATRQNIALLSAHPMLMAVLSLAGRLRVLKLFALLGRLS